jgi:hypothetical protein
MVEIAKLHESILVALERGDAKRAAELLREHSLGFAAARTVRQLTTNLLLVTVNRYTAHKVRHGATSADRLRASQHTWRCPSSAIRSFDC